MKFSHCGSSRHVKDKCYKLHGYPPSWRPRPRFPNPTFNPPHVHQVSVHSQGFMEQQYGVLPPQYHSPYPIPPTSFQSTSSGMIGTERNISNTNEVVPLATHVSNMTCTGMSGSGLLEDEWQCYRTTSSLYFSESYCFCYDKFYL